MILHLNQIIATCHSHTILHTGFGFVYLSIYLFSCWVYRGFILQVLADFPHTTAELKGDYLLDLFPEIQPRSFSIASSLQVANHSWQLVKCCERNAVFQMDAVSKVLNEALVFPHRLTHTGFRSWLLWFVTKPSYINHEKAYAPPG